MSRPGARAVDEATAEAAARYQAWAAGLDDAIARIRRAEGFDGMAQRWQTLSALPRHAPETTPVVPRSYLPTRRAVWGPLT